MSGTDDDTYEAGPVDASVLSQQSQHRSQRIWQGEVQNIYSILNYASSCQNIYSILNYASSCLINVD